MAVTAVVQLEVNTSSSGTNVGQSLKVTMLGIARTQVSTDTVTVMALLFPSSRERYRCTNQAVPCRIRYAAQVCQLAFLYCEAFNHCDPVCSAVVVPHRT